MRNTEIVALVIELLGLGVAVLGLLIQVGLLRV